CKVAIDKTTACRLVITLNKTFFFQAEDGIRDFHVTGVQTCALPISGRPAGAVRRRLAAGGHRLHRPLARGTRRSAVRTPPRLARVAPVGTAGTGSGHRPGDPRPDHLCRLLRLGWRPDLAGDRAIRDRGGRNRTRRDPPRLRPCDPGPGAGCRAGRCRGLPAAAAAAGGADAPREARIRPARHPEPRPHVRGALGDADELYAGAAPRPGHPGRRKDPSGVRALRLLHGDLPDLRPPRRRARRPAWAHLPDEG